MLQTEAELHSYLMANLSTRLTALPFIVWISQRGNAKHDVRLTISPGPKAIPEEMASVGLRPSVHVVAGELKPQELEALRHWVELNREVLLEYWDGELLTDEALPRLRPI